MSCTQKKQLVCFPKVRVYKPWFRHFNDHKDFRNEGTVHLFSLMALFSYANFRSNERVINGDRYMEAPGQWICKLGALPRILRVHSKAQALELMEYFQNHGFLIFEILDEEKEILRFTIADWKEHCTHLQYNYYSYTQYETNCSAMPRSGLPDFYDRLRRRYQYGRKETKQLRIGLCSGTG